MADKKLIHICFGDFRQKIQKLIEYNVTNGLGYTDSFEKDLYHPLFTDAVELESLRIHLGLMKVRHLEMKRSLNY